MLNAGADSGWHYNPIADTMDIIIGDQRLNIKDYYCSSDGEYLPMTDGQLWLYVCLTDICNGSCRFCIADSVREGENKFDLSLFKETLDRIKDKISGVSITGGEPMLYPKLLNAVISIIRDICGPHIEIDMVTNGTGFSSIAETIDLGSLDSVHLSRHCLTDEDNDAIFGFKTVSMEAVGAVLKAMDDPAQIVLNCVLMKNGIDSKSKIVQYLNNAIDMGIRNVSFIGLSKCNEFCKANYVDPAGLDIWDDDRFCKWIECHDHEYCSCSSGSYSCQKGSIRLYFRRMGVSDVPYARQLVYTSDNRLLAGFGGKEIKFGQE